MQGHDNSEDGVDNRHDLGKILIRLIRSTLKVTIIATILTLKLLKSAAAILISLLITIVLVLAMLA